MEIGPFDLYFKFTRVIRLLQKSNSSSYLMGGIMALWLAFWTLDRRAVQVRGLDLDAELALLFAISTIL